MKGRVSSANTQSSSRSTAARITLSAEPTRRGERAGVAVRQHAPSFTISAPCPSHHRQFATSRRESPCFDERADTLRRLAGLRPCSERALQAVDRPEEVDGRRPHRPSDRGFRELDELRCPWRCCGACQRDAIAAATPIAGAPRITIVRIAFATSAAVRQRTYTPWAGSLR